MLRAFSAPEAAETGRRQTKRRSVLVESPVLQKMRFNEQREARDERLILGLAHRIRYAHLGASLQEAPNDRARKPSDHR